MYVSECLVNVCVNRNLLINVVATIAAAGVAAIVIIVGTFSSDEHIPYLDRSHFIANIQIQCKEWIRGERERERSARFTYSFVPKRIM